MNALKTAIVAAATSPIQAGESPWMMKTFLFDEDFLGFRGHFPGYPIVPAFVQILIAVTCIEEWKGISLDVEGIDNAKFQKEIHPGTVVTVEWREVTAQGGSVIQARLKDDGVNASSFLVKWKEKKEEH